MSMNIPGAVDLGALAKAREAQLARDAQPSAPSPVNAVAVIDVTEDTFEDAVLRQSLTVPVIVDLWADWCGPCKQLSPILEALAKEYSGRFVLAKIDVDANQKLSAAFQVQSIPSVFVALGGQVAPLFQGAVAEPQARQVIDAVLEQAAQSGISGRFGDATTEAAPAVVSDPRFDAAEDAISDGDWDRAIAAYREVLSAAPGDVIAKIGLLNVELLQRTDGVDLEVAIAAAGNSVESQLAAADAEFLMNEYQAAFDRIIGLIPSSSGKDRDELRVRALQLFDIAGPTDTAVMKSRQALTNALF